MNQLNVFLTIDTELWLLYDNFAQNIDSSIYGKTPTGEYGLRYQLETLKKFDLNAYFFVDPLFSLRYGKEHLKNMVALINQYQQRIGLHIHTEWLTTQDSDIIDNPRPLNNICEYSLEEQKQLIHASLLLLTQAGAKDVDSFRAGNYGASFDTLKALKENGLKFDTSYNAPYLNNPCQMDTGNVLMDIVNLEQVYEFPVTNFNDYGAHIRHLQLTACSFNEMKFILEQCRQQQRASCTMVLHSFEWIKRLKSNSSTRHELDTICLKRFTYLCEYLANNKDKFITPTYQDALQSINSHPATMIKSNLVRTGARFFEQLKRKI